MTHSFYTVVHKHCDRHRADASRNRRDRRRKRFYLIKFHVSGKFIVFIPVDSDINDYRALFYIICGNKLIFSDRDN